MAQGQLARSDRGRRARRLTLGAAALLVSVGLSAALIGLRDQLESLAALGYLGAFVVPLAASASLLGSPVVLPLVFVLGGTAGLMPLFVGIAAGLGEGIGEMSGYALGRGAGELVRSSRWYPWFDARMDRWGPLLVFAVSLIPNPVVKVVTTAAGASEMPVWRFGLACVAGKTIKMITVAYLGSVGVAAFGL